MTTVQRPNEYVATELKDHAEMQVTIFIASFLYLYVQLCPSCVYNEISLRLSILKSFDVPFTSETASLLVMGTSLQTLSHIMRIGHISTFGYGQHICISLPSQIFAAQQDLGAIEAFELEGAVFR
jgi:hypothetical protein